MGNTGIYLSNYYTLLISIYLSIYLSIHINKGFLFDLEILIMTYTRTYAL